MGHRRDAIEALRAYAHDLDSTMGDGGIERVGSAHQDDATVSGPGYGAPHHGLIVGAVGVVLVGLVGVWAMTGPPRGGAVVTLEVPPVTPAVTATPAGTSNAAFGVRAVARFTTLGLVTAADAVEQAMDSGLDQDEAVVAAISRVLALTESYEFADDPSQDPEVMAAVATLVTLTRPPGLDPDRAPPGHGGVPPDQDDTFTPPGQDDTFTPPGQDDTFTPPGRDDTFTPPGRDDEPTGGTPGSGSKP